MSHLPHLDVEFMTGSIAHGQSTLCQRAESDVLSDDPDPTVLLCRGSVEIIAMHRSDDDSVHTDRISTKVVTSSHLKPISRIWILDLESTSLYGMTQLIIRMLKSEIQHLQCCCHCSQMVSA